ncbi:MAG: Peptidoglycan D,D-transpeptidase MrdA [Elusimicrobia bacterium]|nr:Peptidoglycan D,D-transpeptidase MrdA [Elusimicrobiota bacterium]
MWVGGNTDTFSEKRFRSRVRLASIFFAAGYLIILVRLFQLQVVRGGTFAQLSESNRTQVIYLRAPRGDFFDRKGRVFVTNQPTWSVVYSVPEKSTLGRNEVEETLRPFLTPFPSVWIKRLQKAFDSKQMVRLVENVPSQVAFLMREMELLLPGLRVVMEFRRGYPVGLFAPHLIGYLGEVGERELKGSLKSGDLIGKMGLERIQDDKLRGHDGGMMIEVDSFGRLKQIIKELPYQKGSDVHLTLDLDVQRVAEEELSKSTTKRGAAVVVDVHTGAILAWASAPSFDPTGSMVEHLKDPHSPFLDRVFKGAYPPGSTYKIVTAIAGFEQNAIRTSERVNCVGFVTLPDGKGGEKKYKCWKRHGSVDYWQAMAESCDTYFYYLGQKLGSKAISDMSLQFGFGQAVQDNMVGENKGVTPNPTWKRKMGLGGWSTGDTYNMAIGQGFVTATPLQIAAMMMALATHGAIYRPYALDRIVDINGQVITQGTPLLWKSVQLRESTWEAIDRSLERVVTQGTGVATQISHLDVHGKTGTAQNPHGDDHAWFAGYAGYKDEQPSVALCVLIENGGHGGSVAGPVVRRLLETALPPKPAEVKMP